MVSSKVEMYSNLMFESGMYKTHVVNSLFEYITLIKMIKTENKNLWFRGQNDASFRLTPSILRDVYTKNYQGEYSKISTCMGRGETVIFPSQVDMLIKFTEDLSKEQIEIHTLNEIEKLFLAQHYGLPTKLLDWTTDPMVALFFACDGREPSEDYSTQESIQEFEDTGFSKGGVAVFAIDPIFVNQNSTFFSTPQIFHVSENIDYILEHEKSELPPICIIGDKQDKRMCRQSGNFTLHSQQVWDLDRFPLLKDNMYKIFIPQSCITEIQEFLEALDLTKQSIYFGNDIKDEIAKTIRKNNKEEFLKFVAKERE